MQTHYVQTPSEAVLFVTHIECDNIFLKIWGQTDKRAGSELERLINSLSPHLDQGYGCPPKVTRSIVGELCCAKFQNEGYYRATILDIRSDGMIVVYFIDYGNTEVLSPHHVHLLSAIPGSEHLKAIPPIATEFILSNVLPKNGIWNSETISLIKSYLCYNEYTISFVTVHNCYLMQLLFNNEDFAKMLVNNNLALPATIQEMFGVQHGFQSRAALQPSPQVSQQVPQMMTYQQRNKGNINAMPMAQNQNVGHNAQALIHKIASDASYQKYEPQSPSVQEFKTRVLNVDTRYEVYVSHVEDGPQKFSVQIESTMSTLTQLMDDIQRHPRKPLVEPPLPGSVCLGLYSDGKVLCRAVVMAVMEDKCKLYYVDFGHTTVLSYSDIFQLPPEYINPKVLSIRFTLSGLSELNITPELKELFTQLVSRKLLVLHVRPPEGPPLVQYGDLYDNGVNVKEVMKKVFPKPCATNISSSFTYLHLPQLMKDALEIVVVPYIESCKKFFVQLESGLQSLESVSEALHKYVKTAPTLSTLKVGLPCAALYKSQWYRAEIIDIDGDNIKVFYVDYGNEEELSIMSLRPIHSDLLKLPAQAIKCALKGYEALAADSDATAHFERLVLEKQVFMKVVAAQPKGLLVDLFDDSMRNIHSQLLDNLFCDKTTENSIDTGFYDRNENSPTMKSQNGEIQQPTIANGFYSDDTNKYNKKKATDFNAFQENKSNNWKEDWPSEKKYDNNRYERNTYSARDNSQNDRFKDEGQNRFGRNNRPYNNNRRDRNETGAFNRDGRGPPRGTDENRYGNYGHRYNRNNSDKDSDSSSKSYDKHERGGFNRGDKFNSGFRGREENRNNEDRWNKSQTTRDWTDRGAANKNRPYNKYKNERFNGGDYNNGNSEFKASEDNMTNFPTVQVTCEESWDTEDVINEPQNNVLLNTAKVFPSLDIAPGSVKKCVVSHSNNPSDFFVNLQSNSNLIKMMENDIRNIYIDGGEQMQTFEIERDKCCVALDWELRKWSRAVIESVKTNNATVKFIDYGKTLSVDFTKLKVVRDEFLNLPAQAIHCKMLGAPDKLSNEQNAIFVEKVVANSKGFEMEFVAEENGLHQVLIYDAAENGEPCSYINDQFWAEDMDLAKAKQIAPNQKTFEIMTRSLQAKSKYVSSDAKWQNEFYESGSKYDVTVSWFINPNKFYCQISNKEDEFKALMREIQMAYPDKRQSERNIEVGSIVIARFPEDRVLYRAEVTSKDLLGNYVVHYVDFGNYASVPLSDLYPVREKFLQLPKIAIECSLKDVVLDTSKFSSWSNVDVNALDDCFSADQYECVFHNFKDNQYLVSLKNNGQNVADNLVRRRLAICAKTDAVTDVFAKEASTVSTVDINLLPGQTLRMRISSVENAAHFYVQLPSASKCDEIVNNYMDNNEVKVMPRLSARAICLGAGCLINENGTWRRAVVIDCSRSNGFDVQLIDTGAYDEVPDDVLGLPGELASMQNQALKCSLHGVSVSLEADQKLKDLVGQNVLVHVEEVNENRLFVKLYDLLGNGITNTEDGNEKISPVCPLPVLTSTYQVCLSYADSDSNLWVRRLVDNDTEIKLCRDLNAYYSNNNSAQTLKPEVSLLCAVNNRDGQWQRGRIVSHNEATVYVLLIDSGVVTEVGPDSLQVLESRFYEPHQLVANASLPVALIGSPSEQTDILRRHLMGKTLTANFYNVHKSWTVELLENGEKISDKFRSLNLAKERTSEQLDETRDPLASSKFEVCVSHIDSPSQFWLQRMEDSASLNAKLDQLQLDVSEFPAIDGVPEVGTYCAAVYDVDGLWYYAEVLDADEDITTVRFVDYGNTDVISNDANKIRQLPDTHRDLRVMATKCRLDVIPVDTEDWSDSVYDRFLSLVQSAQSTRALILADTTPKRVDLFLDGKSVSETLVEEAIAIKINTEQEPVDEIVDLELDPHSAFVSHSNSPSEFWIQEEKSVADLEVMADRFLVADMFPKADETEEGLLCVAKYPEDDQWYRARIVSHNQEGTQVIYIDYGNSSVSTDIRAIPDDLASIPPLSRKCCLELPPRIKEWSEEARQEFANLAADGATIFHLEVLKEQQDVSVVKLTLDGRDVTDILALKCEPVVIEERLPPLGEENPPNVMLSYIYSPDEFWIQAESDISELEAMSDRLGSAESFVALNDRAVGTICAAVYPDDGYWYRARIIERDENADGDAAGTKVLYIDYGNCSFTEELRVLPEDIVNIPALSKRCGLVRPSGVDAWSAAASKKFQELSADGNTMFQFESLDEGDPMRVRLSLNGTDVVELLLAEGDVPKVGQTAETELTVDQTGEPSNVDGVDRNLEKLEIHDDNQLSEHPDVPETHGEEQRNEIVECVASTGEISTTAETQLRREVDQSSEPQTPVEDVFPVSAEPDDIARVGEETDDGNIVVLDTTKPEETTLQCYSTSEGNDAFSSAQAEVDTDNFDNINQKLEKLEIHDDNESPETYEEQEESDIKKDIGFEIAECTTSMGEITAKKDIVDIREEEVSSPAPTELGADEITETVIKDPEPIDDDVKQESADAEINITADSRISSKSSESQSSLVENLLEKREASPDSTVDFSRLQVAEITCSSDPTGDNAAAAESPAKKTAEVRSDDSSAAESVPVAKKPLSTIITLLTGSAEKRNRDYARRESRDDEGDECASESVRTPETPIEQKAWTPGTPKTPHSEKLVAAVVNPVVVPSDSDDANDEDEILIVSVEHDIPKHAA